MNERLNEIKLSGKNLLLANIKYKEQTGDKYKSFKIYGTHKSISLLNNEDITQYFVDTTYKCLPNEIEEAKSLLVLIGYNSKKDLFERILVAILSDEDADIFYSFYNFIKGTYKWRPKYITFDFGAANLKAIKEIFNDGDEVTIITCLFHLLQCWWRRAGQLGLRQKNLLMTQK